MILVRHGDAHSGFHGPIGGPKGCAGLTELGRMQAELLRDHLAATGRIVVDELVTSEIPRAVETARIIAPALDRTNVAQYCELCEVHTGEADGVDWADYPTRFGSFDMETEPDRPFAPGGDSWNSFHERVDAAMMRLSSDHVGKTVMAVCHAGVIAASLRVRLGVPVGAQIARLVPSHTGLTDWGFEESIGRWTLRSYNDTRHLDPTVGGTRTG